MSHKDYEGNLSIPSLSLNATVTARAYNLPPKVNIIISPTDSSFQSVQFSISKNASSYVPAKQVSLRGIDSTSYKANIDTIDYSEDSIEIAFTEENSLFEGSLNLSLVVEEEEEIQYEEEDSFSQIEQNKYYTPLEKKIFQEISPLDNLGAMSSMLRLPNESNSDFRQRIINSRKNKASSTVEGLLNGIVNELGLNKKDSVFIDLKNNSEGLENKTPYIVWDGVILWLFKDFISETNYDIDMIIHCKELGINTISELSSYINNFSSTFSSIVSEGGDRPYYCLIPGKNISTQREFLIQTTNVKLSKTDLIPNTVIVRSNNLLNEVQQKDDLINRNDYFVDYENGVIISVAMPGLSDQIVYKHITLPFTLQYSDASVVSLGGKELQPEIFDTVRVETPDIFQSLRNGSVNFEGSRLLSQLLDVDNRWGK